MNPPFRFPSEEEKQRVMKLLEERKSQRLVDQGLPVTPDELTMSERENRELGYKRRAKFITAAWMLGARIAHMASKFGVSPQTISNIVSREIPASVRPQLRMRTGTIDRFEELDALYKTFADNAERLENLPLKQRAQRLQQLHAMADNSDTLEAEKRINADTQS